LGPLQAARKFDYSKQRYFQLRAAFHEGGRGGVGKRETRSQDELSSDARNRPSGDPPPLSRSRRLAASDHPKAQSGRMDDQHPQRGTCVGRVRPAKKTPQVPPPRGKRARRGADQPQSGPAGRRRSISSGSVWAIPSPPGTPGS
jgi:hypothetical protein